MVNKKWHPYILWECWQNGMWKTSSSSDVQKFLQKTIDFTSDHIKYGEAMIDVVKKWPISCEHHLSGESGNKQAYIGHAACCLALGVSEEITRKAWSYLNTEQQHLANNKATEAILYWEVMYANKNI